MMDILMSKFKHVIIYFFNRTPREENLIIKYKYIGAMKPEHYPICWEKLYHFLYTPKFLLFTFSRDTHRDSIV